MIENENEDPDDDEAQAKRRKYEEEKVETAISYLQEHGFEGIQIFVTRYEPHTGITYNQTKGAGNWYSRLGHVSSWVKRQNANEAGLLDQHKDD